MSVGTWQRVSPTKIRILELPVGTWTEDYKLFLEDLVERTPDVKGFENEYTDEVAQFVITFTSSAAVEGRLQAHGATGELNKFENEFRLISSKSITTTNMYLYNERGQIRKYSSARDILLSYYIRRRWCSFKE